MQPIEELLVKCTRPYDTARPIDLSHFVDEDIDWNALLRLGEYHGLIPQIYAHVRTALSVAHNHANPTWMGGFRTIEHAALANAARNVMLAGKLVELVGILRDRGIQVLPFKGPILAMQAYGDISLRAFDDLDLLVRQCDIIPASRVLKQLGYEPSLVLSEAELRAHVRAGWGCTLRSPDRGFFVELDSNIGADFFSVPIDFDELSTRGEEVALEGTTMKTIAMDDLVPLLCAHGTKHLWRRLRWIADLAALCAKQGGVSWSSVLARAGHMRCRRMVLTALALCRSIAGASLPTELEQALAVDTAAVELARDFEAGILESGGRSGKTGHLRALRTRWYARERWRDRIAGALRQAFTPGYSDWKWVRLPPALFVLYWPIRTVRIVLQIISTSFFRQACS